MRDPHLEFDVALKLPRGGVLTDQHHVERFFDEARAAGRLRHPHIVPVHEAGTINGIPYMTSRLVAGQTLAGRLKSGLPYRPTEAATLVGKLASALHHAHSKGVIHRDVKPSNVMLDESGEPHLMDFGLARRERESGLETVGIALIGTPAYMSPEQASQRSHQADARSDLWSLGVILYELLTGTRPFACESSDELVRAVCNDEPPPPRQIEPAIALDLETICLKCLVKEPERRYPSCQHLVDDLERWRRHEPIAARPMDAWYYLAKFVRRNRVLVGGAAVVAVAVVLGLAGTSLGFWRASQAQRRYQAQYVRSLVQQGRLAAQRGNWRTALVNYATAQAESYPDEVELELLKVDALVGIADFAQAEQRLAALAARPDLRDRAATVALWRADLKLSKWEGGDEPLRQIQAAVDSNTLSEADAAYAQALLATRMQEAEEFYRVALRAEPTHYRANTMLMMLQIMRGRFAEARQSIGVAEVLYPDDAGFQLGNAMVSVLEGDRDRAVAVLAAAKSQLGGSTHASCLALIEFLHEFKQMLSQADVSGQTLPTVVGVAWKLQPLLTSFYQGPSLPAAFSRAARGK